MDKMLYCMHVGWNWIKQRPHYLAEKLACEMDVEVISPHCYRVKRGKIKSENSNLHIKEFYKIPYVDRYSGISEINNLLKKVIYAIEIKRVCPQYIYVMEPEAIKCLPQKYKGVLIYDCMDDMLQFTDNVKKKEELRMMEEKLLKRANLILASSEHLMDVLVFRYGEKYFSKMMLVRNGYNAIENNQKMQYRENGKTNQFTLCYFGTIAEWFNFDFVMKSLNDIKELNYLLIGPVQAGTNIPKHQRIHYTGAVSHELLGQEICKADAFVMPFEVTELIESVDPVKLYEYIFFNKNILCVNYKEVERFDEFVFFYNDYETYIKQIRNMMENKNIKFSEDKRKKFLEENTWNVRAESIFQKLMECKNADKI